MTHTYQLDGDGDLSSYTRIPADEYTYAGVGNGSNIYIDTGIVSNDITNFEIVFDYTKGDGNLRTYFGSVQNSTTRCALLKYTNNNLYLAIGDDVSAIDYTNLGLVSLGNIYKINVTIGVGTLNSKLYSYNTTTGRFTLIDDRDVAWSGTLGTYTSFIYNLHYSVNNYYIDETIYYITINNETWYMNEGTGSTVTGSNGTELTINGTLTNFWVSQSDVFNQPHSPQTMEINEVSYSGTGNGTDIYINTGKYADEIESISGTFKFGNEKTGTYDTTVWGAVNSGYTDYFWTRGQEDGLYVYIGSPTAPIWNLSAYMIVGNIYTLTLTNNGSGSWTVTLYNHTLGSQVYSNTDTITGTIPHLPVYMMVRNLGGTLNYPTMRTLYSFSIDGETFYLNKGTGSTVTGSEGTELTINGTLTNFWNVSDIWNYGSNFNMDNSGNVRSPEFDETYTGKTGLGNGTDVEIITTIPAQDITNFSITFQYTNFVSWNVYFGSLTSASDRFCLIKYPSSPGLVFSIDADVYFFTYTPYITLGNIYKLDLSISGTTAHTDFYEWNTSTYAWDLKYSADKTTTNNRGSFPVRIYNRRYGLNNYWVKDKIYSFTINDETWYVNKGTGSTITGTNGTELTVSGTLTNFWQDSEIWNDPAMMKSFEESLAVKGEFVES